jgi:glyoxylase-like metal-dependent hydrolase (beta-lactamase superfamily II)
VAVTQISRFRVSNCYLVEEDDGLTLVDTSFRGSAATIRRAAAQLGAPITRVVLTHAHHDHAGSLADLRARLPDAEFSWSAREATLLAGHHEPEPGEPRGRLRGSLYERSGVVADRLLEDGDRVGSLVAVAAPGHTPGHLALFDDRDGTLVAGDAFLTIGGLFVTTEFRWRFPFPALSGTWHAETALRSARRLCSLEPALLATGHGPLLRDPARPMREAVARAETSRRWG